MLAQEGAALIMKHNSNRRAAEVDGYDFFRDPPGSRMFGSFPIPFRSNSNCCDTREHALHMARWRRRPNEFMRPSLRSSLSDSSSLTSLQEGIMGIGYLPSVKRKASVAPCIRAGASGHDIAALSS